MNIQNTYDSTSLSDLSGKLSVNGPPHFRQGDYTSLLSIRVVEDIFVADGVVFIKDSTSNDIIAQRGYNHQQFNNMNEFMVDFNECFKIQAVMSIDTNNKNTFKIQFKTGYEQAYIDYTGNLQRFLGKSTGQQIILNGSITIDNDNKTSQIVVNYVNETFETTQLFIKDFVKKTGNKVYLFQDTVTQQLIYKYNDSTYSKLQVTYQGNLNKYFENQQCIYTDDLLKTLDELKNDQSFYIKTAISIYNNAGTQYKSQISLNYIKYLYKQTFIDYFNKIEGVINIKYNTTTNKYEYVTTEENSQYTNLDIRYDNTIIQYTTQKSINVIHNNEQLETCTLSIKYVQLKCDTLLCGMSSYQIDPITKQQSLQFGSNVLQVLCPNQMSYQSKNMDLHIKLLESMPLNFNIQDQDNNDIDVQYILQMRFYKQESFQQQSDSGVTAIERHTKRQVFVYMSGDNRQFKLNNQFDQIALCQAYGNIGVQPSIIDAYVISYVYKLKVNDYKFDILHAYETNIENVNNSVFLWKQIPQDSILNFELETTAIEYTQYTNQKQQTIKVDQQPNILLRLFIK
ncbi:Hypothetical_protein [Hexamita inflata]|uniref:Hypothetical_protein n=1 Tax=Hexamita inflata TaxID=28002 RepID=A0AA86N789_9EUKA|nr:Hypothetical protein HINF_LOCUS1656 [Hexamita inflata]